MLGRILYDKYFLFLIKYNFNIDFEKRDLVNII